MVCTFESDEVGYAHTGALGNKGLWLRFYKRASSSTLMGLSGIVATVTLASNITVVTICFMVDADTSLVIA